MKLYRAILLVSLCAFLSLLDQAGPAQASGRPVLDRFQFTVNVNQNERTAYRSSLLDYPVLGFAQGAAMDYWNGMVGTNNHTFDLNQAQWQELGDFRDLIFDGAGNGEQNC
jgi:hypothetical protein